MSVYQRVLDNNNNSLSRKIQPYKTHHDVVTSPWRHKYLSRSMVVYTHIIIIIIIIIIISSSSSSSSSILLSLLYYIILY